MSLVITSIKYLTLRNEFSHKKCQEEDSRKCEWESTRLMHQLTITPPLPSFQLWIILEYYSKLSRCIRGESKKKNWYKSKSAGVRWKQKASWALQMFALYHLNSSHWLCQEWIALAQSEAERNLCYCAIFSPLTTQTVFFPFPFFFLSSSQKASVPVSHTDSGGRVGIRAKRWTRTKSSAASKHQSVRPAPILSAPK